MTETVTVGTWSTRTDKGTGRAVDVLVEKHYEGPGQIKYPAETVSEQRTEVGQLSTTSAPVLKLPLGEAAAVREGDLARVDASTADESLVGRWYRIKAYPASGQVTAHRFPIEEES